MKVMVLSNNNWGGTREGAGRTPLKESQRKKGVKIYIRDSTKEDIMRYGIGKTFSEKAVEIITSELNRRKLKEDNNKNEENSL